MLACLILFVAVTFTNHFSNAYTFKRRSNRFVSRSILTVVQPSVRIRKTKFLPVQISKRLAFRDSNSERLAPQDAHAQECSWKDLSGTLMAPKGWPRNYQTPKRNTGKSPGTENP